MVVYPSLVPSESKLVIPYDGVATLNYWRAGVAVASKPDICPPAPLGALIVAYITQDARGALSRYPMRIFYLSCLREWDGIDAPEPGDDATLVHPASVAPGIVRCELPIKFGRNPHAAHIENHIAHLLAEHRKRWQRYADAHGFILPDHREQFDGERIPF